MICARGVFGSLFLIALFLSAQLVPLSAQNLVTNNSFETYSSVPNNYGQPCRSMGWSNPNGSCTMVAGTGSPDFLHTLGTYPVSIPNSIFGVCAAHTGNAIMGFGTWSALIANYREYVSTTLSSPMIVGQQYTVSFWLTTGKATYYSYRSNNIGIYFSTSPLSQTGSNPINVTPQCNITTVANDSVWQLYSFTIMPSVSYTTMTIGNFYSDALTTRVLATGGSPNAAYYFVDDVTVSPSLPLPVELISFNAFVKNNCVSLEWYTATELNNDYFVIEKSGDASSFEEIGRVTGAGTSSEIHQYTFTDPDLHSGIFFYRLKQVDYDGKYEFSSVVSVEFRPREFLIYLQYTQESLNLELDLNNRNSCRIRTLLLTSQGQIAKEVYISSGSPEKIPINELSSGIYFLQFPDENIPVKKLFL